MEQQLEKYFGFSSFRLGQKEVIEKVMNGESAGAVFPTGSGKSMCYQLPSVLLPHLTLVVSPLLALINDQMQFYARHNIPATKIDSTLTPEQAKQIASGLQQGKYKVLFVSVERFKNERFRNFLSKLKVSMLVIDEAHCISEWGHNFRPDYMKLGEYRKFFNIPQVLLLTATATPRVVDDMCRKFEFPRENVISTGFYRPNLHISILPSRTEERREKLFDVLSLQSDQSSIVYVTQHRTAEETAIYLKARGLSVEPFHAGIKSEERFSIQRRFMSGETKCIVATIAFGMGIDKSNIRNVIHYDLPKSIEGYSQEIGRAGRDGETSQCIVLADAENRSLLENFIYGDTPQKSEIKGLLERIKEAGEEWDFRMYNLSIETRIKQLPLKTLMVYLEGMGIIKPLYSYYADYRFKTITPVQEIVNQFEGERREFVKGIFVHSDKARLWTTVNFEKIMKAFPGNRTRIVKALEYFEEKNFLELETKGITEVYSVLNPSFDANELSDRIFDLFDKRERGEVERIDEVIRLFESNTCITKGLSSYFGENQEWEKCGHCSVCKGNVRSLTIGENNLPQLNTFDFSLYTESFFKDFVGTDKVVYITRYFCGITNPVLTKLKVKKLKGFGLFEKYRFGEVKVWVENGLEAIEE